jgi:RimJ/RimL family protein N-acetyltransferase
MGNKVLETERLLLKPLSFSELSFINSNETDKVDTLIEQEAIFDFVKIAISKKLEKMQNVDKEIYAWYTYWLIIDKDNQKGVGFIGFKGIPDESGYSEVGYSISPNYRRKGLMSEALSSLINWASNFQNCKGITAKRVLKVNVGSKNVLSNCGFKLFSSSSEENNYILKF